MNPGDIYSVYNSLHYGVHTISNYQFIDTTFHTLSTYISGYEHGYNIKKNHQLVIGAKKVCWKDYLLPQTIYNKQDILNHLSVTDTSALIIINHPLVRNGYSASDFTKLGNYNCIEVLNPACNSSRFWDAALSAGKPVFIIGDDDAHDVFDTNRVGSMCTFVNVKNIGKKDVIQAIKTGCSYGMTIGQRLKGKERMGDNESMPVLNSFVMNKDTMQVRLSLPAKQITVYGKNGKEMYKAQGTDSLSYILTQGEPYARIVAVFNDDTKLYLNPVYRYKKTPFAQIKASVLTLPTLFLRTLGTVLLFFWMNTVISLLFKTAKRRAVKKHNQKEYEYLPNGITSQNNKVWNRRIFGFVSRFFYYLAVQRKREIE